MKIYYDASNHFSNAVPYEYYNNKKQNKKNKILIKKKTEFHHNNNIIKLTKKYSFQNSILDSYENILDEILQETNNQSLKKTVKNKKKIV